MEIGTKTKEVRPYVLRQPETIPILLRVLKMELLVQFEFQLSAHTDMFFIKGITDLAKNRVRSGLWLLL